MSTSASENTLSGPPEETAVNGGLVEAADVQEAVEGGGHGVALHPAEGAQEQPRFAEWFRDNGVPDVRIADVA